ncbi:MAG: hypothetical protein IPM29_07260 [Planctomycetes bacterium]|nr:hypothetical protein [Planctomycetota bacterium]
MAARRRPRRSGAGPRPAGHRERKLAQLAAQIGRSIEQTLAAESQDELLQSMTVEGVQPTASGSRMVVTLMVHGATQETPKAEVLARLESFRSTIVRHIAEDVTRRALPELSFWLILDPDAMPEGDDADDDESDWGYDPFDS